MKNERNYLAKLFARKSWRRVVRFLSCLVVFCTTYALILPAFTKKAQTFCGMQEHEHGPDCYKQILSCLKEEHTHSGDCFDEDGNLICTLEEHVHTSDCYREILDCSTEVHTHSLICYSNPNADLEDEKDWEDSLPKEEKKETTRENVVATAWSQKNVSESRNNYQVDNETEIRGISRYGQWDQDPYEDNWSGSFVRFVMHYGGVKDDSANEKNIYPAKDVIDWMNNLSDHHLLVPVNEAREGDIVFINDSEDEIKAGVILDTDQEDSSFRAMMGDWMDQVSVQKFDRDDSKIHSAFLIPVNDDPAEADPDDNQNQASAQEPKKDPETEDKENVESPNHTAKPSAQDKDNPDNPESGSEKTKPDSLYNETDLEQTPSTEDVKNDGNKTVLTAEAEDGTIVTASFEDGTFSYPSEAILFQARPTVLTDKENEKIYSYLDSETNYQFNEYDLGFYVRPEETADLVKIEPEQPVEVKIQFSEDADEDVRTTPDYLFHIKDSGEIECLSVKDIQKDSAKNQQAESSVPEKPEAKTADESGEKSGDSSESEIAESTVKKVRKTANDETQLELIKAEETGITFRSSEFSKYITAHPSDINYLDDNDVYWNYKNILTKDIDNWTTVTLSGAGTTEIDLCGYTIKGNGPLFKVTNGHHLIITNSQTASTSQSGSFAHVDGETAHSLTYTNHNSFYNDDGNLSGSYTTVSNIGMLIGNNGNVLEIDGGTLQIENAGICSWNGTGIFVNNGNLDLEKTYVVQGKRGLLVQQASKVRVSGGAIADHDSGTDWGAGIYCDSGLILLEDGVEVTGNKARNAQNSECAAGGIAVKGHNTELKMQECYISANYTTSGDNDGSFATGAGIKAWDGATVSMNHPQSTVSNNWAKGSGGGISIQDNDTKFYMYDGLIDGNICCNNEGGGLALQAKRGNSQAYLYGGTISNNRSMTTQHWGGGGVFCGEEAKLILPFGAYVTDNTADVYGGGIAGCSTGKIVVDNSVIVAGNEVGETSIDTRATSGEKPHDRTYSKSIGLTKDGAHDYFTCFYASVNGQFGDDGAAWHGKVDTKDNVVDDVNSGWITTQTCMGLTSHYTGDGQGKKLVITGNYSNMHGGGILINGYLIGGDVEYIYNSDVISLTGKKTVVDPEGNVNGNPEGYLFELWDEKEENLIGSGSSNSSGSFSIPSAALNTTSSGIIKYILKEGKVSQAGVVNDTRKYRIEINVTTTAKDPWTYERRAPKLDDNGNYQTDQNGNIIFVTETVTVREYETKVASEKDIKVFEVPGDELREIRISSSNQTDGAHQLKTQWTINLSPNGDAAFENKRVNTFDLEVVKDWEDGADKHTAHTVKVQLYRSLNADHSSPEKYLEEVVLMAGNSWKHEYKDLPATDVSNFPYYYWIQETGAFDQSGQPVTGYLTEVKGITDIGSGSSEDVYTDQNAWIEATSLEAGKEYILVDTSSNKILANHAVGDVQSTSMASATPLKTKNGVIAYPEDVTAQIMVARSESNRRGLVMRAKENDNYGLAGNYDQEANVLHWYEGNLGQNDDLNGFEIDNSKNLKLYRWGSNAANYDYVICSDGSFKLQSTLDTNKAAKFFKLGKVQASSYQQTTGKKYQITIENKKIKNSVVVTKTDENDKTKLLAGAVFGIYSDENATTLIEQKTTSEDGKVTFENLSEGNYWIKEIQAPEGYELNTNIFPVSFSNTANKQAVITTDQLVTDKVIYYELPETGGPGTQWLTNSGLLLLAGSGLLMIRKIKRRKAGEPTA